jgi:hypothetical protein
MYMKHISNAGNAWAWSGFGVCYIFVLSVFK